MSEFNDRPFVAGTVVGYRAFDVDSLGRLTGPQYGGVFKPGENVAVCHTPVTFSTQMSRMQARIDAMILGGTTTSAAFAPTPVNEEPDHTVGSLAHSCGYYAYFDGDNTYSMSSRVEAVVEGYGTVTVGSRGFKAEKARLVALVLPDERHQSKRHARYDRWADFAYRHEAWGTTAEVLLAMLGIFVASMCIAGADDAGSPWPLLGLPSATSMLYGSYWLLRLWRHGLHRSHPLIHPELTCVSRGPGWVGLVRRNYPDVPTYPTLKDAMKAHPPTRPAEPTPDDEDFWTREARS